MRAIIQYSQRHRQEEYRDRVGNHIFRQQFACSRTLIGQNRHGDGEKRQPAMRTSPANLLGTMPKSANVAPAANLSQHTDTHDRQQTCHRMDGEPKDDNGQFRARLGCADCASQRTTTPPSSPARPLPRCRRSQGIRLRRRRSTRFQPSLQHQPEDQFFGDRSNDYRGEPHIAESSRRRAFRQHLRQGMGSRHGVVGVDRRRLGGLRPGPRAENRTTLHAACMTNTGAKTYIDAISTTSTVLHGTGRRG